MLYVTGNWSEPRAVSALSSSAESHASVLEVDFERSSHAIGRAMNWGLTQLL